MLGITDKQINYIVFLIEKHNDPGIKGYFAEVPKYNDEYPDKRADYRRLILTDNLRAAGWSIVTAHKFIYLLNNKPGQALELLREL